MLSALCRGFQSAQEHRLSYAGKQSHLPALTASPRVNLVLYNNSHLLPQIAEGAHLGVVPGIVQFVADAEDRHRRMVAETQDRLLPCTVAHGDVLFLRLAFSDLQLPRLD